MGAPKRDVPRGLAEAVDAYVTTYKRLRSRQSDERQLAFALARSHLLNMVNPEKVEEPPARRNPEMAARRFQVVKTRNAMGIAMSQVVAETYRRGQAEIELRNARANATSEREVYELVDLWRKDST